MKLKLSVYMVVEKTTLNKKFIECVKYIKDKNIHCSTITNGYRLDDKLIQEISESGLDVIRISDNRL